MASVPFWNDDPKTWETVSLGGTEIPGVCRLSGDGMKLKIDSKKAAGRHGASVAFLGQDAVSFVIEVRMWLPEHLETFQTIIQAAKPQAKYKAVNGSKLTAQKGAAAPSKTVRQCVGYDQTPLEVSHPALALFGISSCIVESATLPMEQAPGIWTASLRCREFRPPEETPVSRGTAGNKKQVGILDGVNSATETPSPAQTNSGRGHHVPFRN